MIIKNKGYAPGLDLDRHGISSVTQWWLRDLLLVLLDHLLELVIFDGHDLRQLVLYMHAMMMQHLVIRQQQILKYEYLYQATKLTLMTKTLSYLLFPLNRYKTFHVLS